VSSLSDPRAIRSDEAISAAFLRLLEQNSVDQITIKQIVEEAGVHRATFFRHHACKEDLLNHIAAAQIRNIVALTLPILDKTDNYTSTHAFCVHVYEHRTLWTTLLTGGAASTLREEWLRLAIEIAADRARPSWLPITLAVRCTVAVIAETMAWWLSEAPATVSVDEITKILHRAILSFAEAAESPREQTSPRT
jgi:AcrR family transcriptional regulator